MRRLSKVRVPPFRLLSEVRGLQVEAERLLRPNAVGASAIDLEEIDSNLFVAPERMLWQPAGGVGVFGGQVLGQALHAATLTADSNFECHSLHAYFLRAGDSARPIVYRVKRTRDGRSFLSRSVEATQGGRVIFKLSASFHLPEPDKGISHQTSMPDVPIPEECTPFDFDEVIRNILEKTAKSEQDLERSGKNDKNTANGDEVETSLSRAKRQVLRSLSRAVPMDIRWVGKEPSDRTPRPARQLAWMRVGREIGSDAPLNLHRAAAAFFSDYFLLATSLLPYGVGFPSKKLEVLASLDHSMWFHAPFKADEWMLCEFESPAASGARALSFGRLYRQDGALAVTCAQEGLVRLRSDIHY